jgi:large subunit ribosomal protein L24e
MPACTFCKQNYNFPRGTTVVQKDASVKYFCSSKCRKNSEMGRLNKKVKWVKKSSIVKDEKAKKDLAYKARKEILEVEKSEKSEKNSARKIAKK